jgi:hypothetical protein
MHPKDAPDEIAAAKKLFDQKGDKVWQLTQVLTD